MRAWLAILAEKHPQHTWIAAKRKSSELEADIDGSEVSDATSAEHVVRAA
jgi:hypothetical protein